MGVRYVVVPSTQGRDGGAAGDAPVALRRAMAQQLDLARLRSSRGIVLYENVAYAPIRAAVSPPALPVDSRRPNRAALTTDLTRGAAASGATPPGTAFWGEAYDSEWKATRRRRPLRHQESFGWANGFVVRRRGDRVDRVRSAVGALGDARRRAGHLAARALAVASHPGAARSVAPRAVASRQRRERSAKPDPLAELDDEAFWWERV